jgi:hypothetical protein
VRVTPSSAITISLSDTRAVVAQGEHIQDASTHWVSHDLEGVHHGPQGTAPCAHDTGRPPQAQGRGGLPEDGSGGYQLTGSALPSSYPAADCTPTSARSRNSSIDRAPAYVNELRTPEVIMSSRSSSEGRSGSR